MTFGELSDQTLCTPKPLEEYEFHQGRFKGFTFLQVAENKSNKKYCEWVKSNKKLSGAMGTFRDYLLSR